MLTCVTDYVKWVEVKRAAARLLQERYGRALSPEGALDAVLSALGRRATGQKTQGVPADEVLAALAHVAEARENLDKRELRLITEARDLGVSWQRLADALGLATRQSAETRALRLDRAVHTSSGRDVASQRLAKARDRAADAWCVQHEGRVRDLSERLFDTAGAWDMEAIGGTARVDLHALGELLASGGSPVALAQRLESLRLHLAPPHRDERPKPAGKHAGEAVAARMELTVLIAERDDARQRVTTARGEVAS